jgi:hypothetical protein
MIDQYTERGFRIYAEFTDVYGSAVSVNESSLATDSCVWVRAKDDKDAYQPLHLNRWQAERLVAALREWLDV